MKRMKKILAMVMAMAMVLGMSLTTFAAPNEEYTSSITINGLVSGDNTTVNVFRIIYLDDTTNDWVIEEWAKNYVVLNGNSYEVTNPAGLEEAIPTDLAPTYHAVTQSTSHEFEDVLVGAYVIVAAGSKATYTTMIANTYSDVPGNVVKDAEVYAKASGYEVTKEAEEGDNFVARGEEVTFTITTTFPSFEEADSNDNSFKIIDTPDGLEIQRVDEIKIGNDDVDLEDVEYGYDSENENDYVIDLSSQIGTGNANAGKTVTVTYTAVVTADDGYSNTANASRNDVNIGEGEGNEVNGYTADITISKYNENGTEEAGRSEDNLLSGAEFTVTKIATADKENIAEEDQSKILFVKVADGVYKVALDGEEGASATIVATNGTVQIKGLDGGTYHFEEITAPDGYSINGEGVDVTVEENENQNVSMSDHIVDTKLSSLPSTGGIGTTIFTIGGVAIMVVAAGLFFVTRKKASK